MSNGVIGVLGGTFNPPHLGHIALAIKAIKEHELMEVRMVPAGDPYHKSDEHLTPAKHRLEMTRLAIKDHKSITVDDREVIRAGPSYTVDTLKSLHNSGLTNLALLIGSDLLPNFSQWHESQIIESLADIIVATRNSQTEQEIFASAKKAGLQIKPRILNLQNVNFSSTQIRKDLQTHLTITGLSTQVLTYIRKQNLYSNSI